MFYPHPAAFKMLPHHLQHFKTARFLRKINILLSFRDRADPAGIRHGDQFAPPFPGQGTCEQFLPVAIDARPASAEESVKRIAPDLIGHTALCPTGIDKEHMSLTLRLMKRLHRALRDHPRLLT